MLPGKWSNENQEIYKQGYVIDNLNIYMSYLPVGVSRRVTGLPSAADTTAETSSRWVGLSKKHIRQN